MRSPIVALSSLASTVMRRSGNANPLPLESIQRVEHDRHLLGHGVDNEGMILPFEACRGETQNAEVRCVPASLRNRLRADAAMRNPFVSVS